MKRVGRPRKPQNEKLRYIFAFRGDHVLKGRLERIKRILGTTDDGEALRYIVSGFYEQCLHGDK